MAKPFQEFERLVARIEKCLQAHGGVVTSPDMIRDIDTNQPRQIDATVRVKAGSIDLLCVIECRKHKDRQSTKWIEELYGRTRSLGANKIVAVTDRQMSRPAMTKARKWGIDVRKVTSFNVADIPSIIGITDLLVTQYSIDYKAAFVRWKLLETTTESERESIKEYVAQFGLFDPFIRHEPSKDTMSIDQLWHKAYKPPLFDVLHNATTENVIVPLTALHGGSMHIDCPVGTYEVLQIEYKIYKRRVGQALSPPSQGFEYSDDNQHVANIVEYDLGFIRPGEKLTVARKQGDSNIYVSGTDGLIMGPN